MTTTDRDWSIEEHLIYLAAYWIHVADHDGDFDNETHAVKTGLNIAQDLGLEHSLTLEETDALLLTAVDRGLLICTGRYDSPIAGEGRYGTYTMTASGITALHDILLINDKFCRDEGLCRACGSRIAVPQSEEDIES